MKNPNYTSIDHIHNYASWTAAAASRMAFPKKLKIKNTDIIALINKLDLIEAIKDNSKLLCLSAREFDHWHAGKRVLMSETVDSSINTYHGLFAKIINIYLKTALLCNLDNLNRAINIHPPLDGFLLVKWKKETKNNKTRVFIEELPSQYRDLNGVSLKVPVWSKFSSKEYENLIRLARDDLGEKEPLWKLEHFWILSD